MRLSHRKQVLIVFGFHKFSRPQGGYCSISLIMAQPLAILMAVGSKDKDDDFALMNLIRQTTFLAYTSAPLPRTI